MKIEVGFVDAERWVDGHFEDENCEGKTIHWISICLGSLLYDFGTVDLP